MLIPSSIRSSQLASLIGAWTASFLAGPIEFCHFSNVRDPKATSGRTPSIFRSRNSGSSHYWATSGPRPTLIADQRLGKVQSVFPTLCVGPEAGSNLSARCGAYDRGTRAPRWRDHNPGITVRIAEFRSPRSAPLRRLPSLAKPAPASGGAASSPPGRAARVKPWGGDRELPSCPRHAPVIASATMSSRIAEPGLSWILGRRGDLRSKRQRLRGKRFSQRPACQLAAVVSI
jgi:hypothetical protein